ncbi:MAG: tRNA adenosine(34) deaminase TadA [Burkholderiales bacterium]|nr:tRNA adenosine(34) deaminase TadA [Burkholderiales bacterium]
MTSAFDVPPGHTGTLESTDDRYMRMALAQAREAAIRGEVPVGAVVVKDDEVIATGANSPLSENDPTAHAEIAALRAAGRTLGNYRLEGCTLYVTLEPCSMCAGAMLHSRLARVVFGAPDPKTGAAGSVLNLFSNKLINHHTQVSGGVLHEECAVVVQAFFRKRREVEKAVAQPLREDALRTPDKRFAGLPGYPWQGRYTQQLPSLRGLRMHFLDEGPQDAKTVLLCLHGNPAWSYLYRKMIPVWLDAGHRIVAPDLIGFGKSDKPKRETAHTFEFHRNCLLELVESLNLSGIVLVVQDWGGILGLTLPMEVPSRYKGLVVMNTVLATGESPLSPGFLSWREMCRKKPDFDVGRLLRRGNPEMDGADSAAYNAPFPDAGYRAALRAFPEIVPDRPDAPGADLSQRAAAFLKSDWQGKTVMAVGALDPVLGVSVMERLQKQIRYAPQLLVLPSAGHFVQEQGAELAHRVVELFADR